MNKIVIGALIAIITWEIGAQLAQNFETKAIILAQETSSPAPERAEDPARKAPETAPPARKSPEPVQTAPRAQKPEKAQEEFEAYHAQRNKELDDLIESQSPALWKSLRVNDDPYDKTIHKKFIAKLIQQPGLKWDIDGPISPDSIGLLRDDYPHEDRHTSLERMLNERMAEARRPYETGKLDYNIWGVDFYEEVETSHEYRYFLLQPGVPEFYSRVSAAISERNEKLARLGSVSNLKDPKTFWNVYYIEKNFEMKMNALNDECNSFSLMLDKIPKPSQRGLTSMIPVEVQDNWDEIKEAVGYEGSLAWVLANGYAWYEDSYDDFNPSN